MTSTYVLIILGLVKIVNPLDVLRLYVGQFHTQREAAEALGITPAYLSDVLHERRLFSKEMLAKLGLERIVVVVDARKANPPCASKIA